MAAYLAHTRPHANGVPQAVQSADTHCRNTAVYTAQALEPVNLSACGYLAGLLHDAGKFTRRFQNYLLHDDGVRGSVIHTFTGVRFFLTQYHDPVKSGEFADIVSEVLALAVGGHHGLFDCVDHGQKNGFQHRLDKKDIDYAEAIDGFTHFCASQEELDRRFQEAREEMVPLLERICHMTGEEASDIRYDTETAFYSGLLARLLLSAVIAGDRQDTAEFMNCTPFPAKQDTETKKRQWGECLDRVEERLEKIHKVSCMDKARQDISNLCRQAAESPGGVFRLHVPTGGGKTLSSLRYALAHARKYEKQRIIFTSPLLSILEQNAAVIREYVQDNSLILEHHSNLVQEKEDFERLDQTELLTETWDAPIIITTLVQLLNTLFSGKTSAIRRFYTLCGSVIVIDEVQTVPSKMLSMFSLAVNFLAEIGGATIVLCSATQPCIEQIEHPLHTPIQDLIPYSVSLWQTFQRTVIQDAGEMSLEQIAGFAWECLENKDSLLIVCNKKGEAEALFQQLEGMDVDLFLLSAAMCTAHRRETLEKLRTSLAGSGQKTVCVSTQVIEAGVDISFACVIRLAAGMDSVVQAAGRCNRHGEAKGLAPVYLVQVQNESLSHLPDIQRGKNAARELLNEFVRCPERYQQALDSDAAIQYYYRALYRHLPLQYHDYKIPDQPSLLSLLTLNDYCREDQPFYFRQAFRTAGRLFEVFEQAATDVIVPYQKGRELMIDLCSERAKYDPVYRKTLLEEAKPYTVSIYQYQIDRLAKDSALVELPSGVFGLSGHYNEQTGFSLEESNLEFLGVE